MSEPNRARARAKLTSVWLGGTALLVVIGIVQSPGEAFRASLSGLQVWWQQVFPGLVPPLILAELLAASGMLHGLAVLAEPLTRSLFRLPGSAGWAAAFGWAAGVPAGAKETARLRDAGLLRDEDTPILLLLSHVPNPFLVVVIAGAGFLQSPLLGWAVAAGVWSAAVLGAAALSRLFRVGKPAASSGYAPKAGDGRFRQAAMAAGEARREDGRPLGKQLADGVTHAVTTLMGVGGLMMMTSVVLRLIQLWIPGSDAWLAVPGLYEMHLGAYETGRSPLFESAPAHAAALLAAALAWTGWSGLLQARAAFGAKPAFPWAKLIAGKLLQSAIALLVTFPLARAALAGEPALGQAILSFYPFDGLAREAADAGGPLSSGWRHLPEMWLSGLSSLAVFLLLALLAVVIRPPRKRRPPDRK